MGCPKSDGHEGKNQKKRPPLGRQMDGVGELVDESIMHKTLILILIYIQ